MALIDTHAHLTFPDFDQDRENVLKRSWRQGLEYIITIGAGLGLEGNFSAVGLAQQEPKVYATVGVHPHDAGEVKESWYKDLKKLAGHDKVVAIGEIGLDFFKNISPAEDQLSCFRRFLGMAGELDLPVVIHARDAETEVLEVLKEVGRLARGGVFHCFSGDVRFAEQVIKLGFNISVPGIVTFDKARQLQEVVAAVPLEKIILETDCPYLAPEPKRGKRNEPAFVNYTAQKIAELKSLSKEDVARITGLAAKRLFGLPGGQVVSKIAYQIRNSMYLNITNKCTLSCTFCPKNAGDYEVKGHYLKLEKEPTVEEIFQALGEPEEYDEVVFCGYGEPTQRLEILKVIASRMKQKGVKSIRLNTDGLSNLVYQRNIAAELKGLIDVVSISLNAADAATYARLCPSEYGENTFSEVINFIKECKKYIPEVVVTAVALPNLDLQAVKKLAQELAVKLRIREYQDLG